MAEASSSKNTLWPVGIEEEDLDAWDLLDDKAAPSSYASSVTTSADELVDAWVVMQKKRTDGGLKGQEQIEHLTQEAGTAQQGSKADAAAQERKNEARLLKGKPKPNPYARDHEVSCQLCDEKIWGDRWMCKECPTWNLCERCINLALVDNEVHPGHTMVRILQPYDVVRLVPTQVQRRSKLFMPLLEIQLHPDETCSTCESSIIGVRYECAVRECRRKHVVFCQDCEARPINAHPPSHPLIKYKMRKKDSMKVDSMKDSSKKVGSISRLATG